jgi:tetratricopeptide (TPR) repeat protein
MLKHDSPPAFEDEVENLHAAASAALRAGDFDGARELSARLLELRHPGHFEIEALLLLEEGEAARAIEVLREGVRRAPEAWVLQQLLGNALSDVGDYDGALQSYERAAELPGADASMLLFNRSIVLSRAARHAESLQVLESIGAAEIDARNELRAHVAPHRLRVLEEMGRCDEVLEEAATLRLWLETLHPIGSEGEPEESVHPRALRLEHLGQAWAMGAMALDACEQFDEAREWARQALQADRCCEDALLLLRELTTNAPTAAQFWNVTLEGDWIADSDESEEADEESQETKSGFFTTFAVVARDADEARNLALAMEEPHWPTPLRVEECEVVGACDEQAVGVTQASPYMVFERHPEDEKVDEN